ncbi:cupin domain-containing protein [Candidatus Methylocalor cossyra]|uniref:ChrR-like cupin domain-containing protein n=1 Tax=Candidatus Methylocalor cossyra TaxID=3108543 RepID=A0ABM9NL61_9GAMM
MADHPEASDQSADLLPSDGAAWWLEGLAPVAPPPERREALRACLLQRAAQSLAERAGLTTVRAKDGLWRPLKRGIRIKPLAAGTCGQSVLIELAPGAALPMHRHRWVEEGIVLRGDVCLGELQLRPFDYHVSPAGSRHPRIRSQGGALAFLRGTSVGHTPSLLLELLTGLLPFAGEPPRTVPCDGPSWREIAPGVTEKRLWSDGTWVSRYLRLEPSARVPGHPHRAAEECLMLEGDVFLGDILLRPGDYQWAAPGSRHGEVFSDTGALLFVRGAVDP